MPDVIVVVPGIMGSTLHRHGAPVWEPSRGAVVEALTSLNRNLRRLRLPADIGDAHPEDGVEAVDLMNDPRLPFGLWTFDLGYTALLQFFHDRFEVTEPDPLRPDEPANLIRFAYDWRLSNRLNGVLLGQAAERALERWRASADGSRASAELVFVCHSMGGLVARWYIDRLGGAALTRTLITIGTPHRGALNALDQLVNGVRKGPGFFKINLTDVARSLPALHQLLPEYACIETTAGLAKTSEISDLPDLRTADISDAMLFHQQIDEARTGYTDDQGTRHHPTSGTYALHLITGTSQPTATTARLNGRRLITVRTIAGADEGGDGTVPRLSATPVDLKPNDPCHTWVSDGHVDLVHNQAVFDQIEGILTATGVVHRGGDIEIAVDAPEVLDHDDPCTVSARVTSGDEVALEVVRTTAGSPDTTRLQRGADGWYRAELGPLPAGVHRLTVQGTGNVRARVQPVTSLLLVWPPDAAFAATSDEAAGPD